MCQAHIKLWFWFGLTMPGMAWFGLVWHGMLWVWLGKTLLGLAWVDLAWSGLLCVMTVAQLFANMTFSKTG